MWREKYIDVTVELLREETLARRSRERLHCRSRGFWNNDANRGSEEKDLFSPTVNAIILQHTSNIYLHVVHISQTAGVKHASKYRAWHISER